MTVGDAASFPGVDPIDAELLIAHALGKRRTWVIAHPEKGIAAPKKRRIIAMLKRRKSGEPLAYIVGIKEFHGRDFFVTKDTLIPRPATEGLVTLAANLLTMNMQGFHVHSLDAGIVGVASLWKSPTSCAIVDIGTGSGCIAVTLKKMFPRRTVIATDISSKALNVARRNAKRHRANVLFKKGSALGQLKNLAKPFLIVSNPPYIPRGVKLMKDVADFEPQTALFAGKNGTDVIDKILRQAKAHPHCVGVILECRADQLSRVRDALPI